jgi:hypothetical protein
VLGVAAVRTVGSMAFGLLVAPPALRVGAETLNGLASGAPLLVPKAHTVVEPQRVLRAVPTAAAAPRWRTVKILNETIHPADADELHLLRTASLASPARMRSCLARASLPATDDPADMGPRGCWAGKRRATS